MSTSFADALASSIPDGMLKAASGIKPWAVPNIAQGGHTMATTGKVVGGVMGGGAAVTPTDTAKKTEGEEEAQPSPSNPLDASLQASGVDPAGVAQQHEMAQSEATLSKAKADAEIQKLQQSSAPKDSEAMSPAVQAHQMTLDHQKQLASNTLKDLGSSTSSKVLDQRIKATMSRINKVIGASTTLPHQIKMSSMLAFLPAGLTKEAYGMGPGPIKPAPAATPAPLPEEPSNLAALTKARAAGNTKAVQAAGGSFGGALLRDQNADLTNRNVREYGHTGPFGPILNGANVVVNGVGSLLGHEESSRNFDAFLHPFQSPALTKIQEDATKPLAPGELEAYKNPNAHMIERQQAMTDAAVADNNSNAVSRLFDRATDAPGNTPYGTDGSWTSRLGNGSYRYARNAYRNFAQMADQLGSGSPSRMLAGEAGTSPDATLMDKAKGFVFDSTPSHLLQGIIGMNPVGTVKSLATSALPAGQKLLFGGLDVWGNHSMAKNTAPSETQQVDAVHSADQGTLDTMKANGGHLPGERGGFAEMLNWILSLIGMGRGPSQAQQQLQGFDRRQNLIAPAY